MNTAKQPDLDLEREKDWAEVLLGGTAQDMRFVLEMLAEVPTGEIAHPRIVRISMEIITAYCRPFTKNNRGNIRGKRWIKDFSSEEMKLHRRALTIRDDDLAHTAHCRKSRNSYRWRSPTRRREQTGIARGAGGCSLLDERRYPLLHSLGTGNVLALMVGKIRERIEIEKSKIGEQVFALRFRAGFTKWFALGDPNKGA